MASPETELEKNKIWGNQDSLLSDLGSELLANIDPHVISGINIAYMPAQYQYLETSRRLKIKNVTIANELIGRHMGNLTKKTREETIKLFPRRKWLEWQRSYWVSPPEGESYGDITDRAIKVLEILDKSKNILIIASSEVIKVCMGYLLKIDEIKVPAITVEPCVPYLINNW